MSATFLVSVTSAQDAAAAIADPRVICLLSGDAACAAAADQAEILCLDVAEASPAGAVLAPGESAKTARAELGEEASLIARCTDRHSAMQAAEQSADLIWFEGPDAAETAAWWASVMEVPCALPVSDQAGLDAVNAAGIEHAVLADAGLLSQLS